MRAVVVGAVAGTKVAVDAFAGAGWDLTLVVTLPLEASQRHSDFVDLGESAANVGATVHRTRQVNAPETLHAIEMAKPDFLFVVGWSQICGLDFLGICPGKVIGYHPAPIPRLRGRAVIPWTILLEEPISAGTMFWMDRGVDSGPILDQQFFHVAPDETAATLYAKHMAALATMMRRALASLARGDAGCHAQDERCATYAARRIPTDGRIDWHMSAPVIDRLIRAVGRPYPGAFTTTAGCKRLTVWRSSFPSVHPRYHAIPGQIVAMEADTLTVMTGRGLLRVEEWEGEPGPRMHSILGDAG